ncbi:flagellar protein FlaG [Idiomarina loihiensis]|uniref:flagellar protein FlaG n=1 Tax=Idiomarina loihiensis TaxID=135577 RepID=UPI00384AE62E
MGIEIHSGMPPVGVSNNSEQKTATGVTDLIGKAEKPIAIPSEKTQTSEFSEKTVSDMVEDLQSVVDGLNVNDSMRQHNLEFKVNEELERTIVKVVDSDSGEVIRQIPSEELVAIAERIEQQAQDSDDSVGYFINGII